MLILSKQTIFLTGFTGLTGFLLEIHRNRIILILLILSKQTIFLTGFTGFLTNAYSSKLIRSRMI